MLKKLKVVFVFIVFVTVNTHATIADRRAKSEMIIDKRVKSVKSEVITDNRGKLNWHVKSHDFLGQNAHQPLML